MTNPLAGEVADVRGELVKLADAVDDNAALMTRAELGEMALAWRREAKAASALPWGTPERVQAFGRVGITCEIFWQAVDAVLASAVPAGDAGSGDVGQ